MKCTRQMKTGFESGLSFFYQCNTAFFLTKIGNFESKNPKMAFGWGCPQIGSFIIHVRFNWPGRISKIFSREIIDCRNLLLPPSQ